MRTNRLGITMSLILVSMGLYGCGGRSSTIAPPASYPGTVDSKVESTSVTIYKYLGSVQCTGGGTSLPAMQRELADAGIRVLSANCGSDGRMYVAVCGAGDGRIGIFEVPATQAEAASSLGFAPFSNLPEAHKIPCLEMHPER